VADNLKLDASKNLVKVFELAQVTADSTGEQLSDLIRDQVKTFYIINQGQTQKLVTQKPSAPSDLIFKAWASFDENGKLSAYAFPVGGKGFWGPIEGIMSVGPDGETIRTVVWTKHGETPGLGARIEEDGFREQFRGKKALPPTIKKFQVVAQGNAKNDPHKVDQITGATQTTVVGLGSFLNDNFEAWHKYRPLLENQIRKGR